MSLVWVGSQSLPLQDIASDLSYKTTPGRVSAHDFFEFSSFCFILIFYFQILNGLLIYFIPMYFFFKNLHTTIVALVRCRRSLRSAPGGVPLSWDVR